MTRIREVVSMMVVCAVAALLFTPPAATQIREVSVGKGHRLVLQVNTDEPAMMNLALNNAANVEQYYRDLGEKVEIEIVAFGPGLHMLRDDTSPVKERIKALREKAPHVVFAVCDNTRRRMEKEEGRTLAFIPGAVIVPSGVVRLMELGRAVVPGGTAALTSLGTRVIEGLIP